MRTPESDNVTRSREDDEESSAGGGVGVAGTVSGWETINAASAVTASGCASARASPESFLRHRPKVLTASPCSRQKRRRPSPLVVHAMTISRQNASPCRGRRAPVGTASSVASSIALPRRYDGITFAPRLRVFKTGCADGYVSRLRSSRRQLFNGGALGCCESSIARRGCRSVSPLQFSALVMLTARRTLSWEHW